MVIGFHIIGTTYGFWLPNDQRGSGSDHVRNPALRPFGPATKGNHGRSVARAPQNYEVRRLAREALRYDPVEFNNAQIQSVAKGFENEISEFGGTILEGAILGTHFHLVTGQHPYDIRRFVGRLRGAATKQLRADGLHPFQQIVQSDGSLPSPWGRLPWVVYCFTEEDIERSIDYAKKNVLRARIAPQNWSWLTPYSQWLEELRTGRGAAHHR